MAEFLGQNRSSEEIDLARAEALDGKLVLHRVLRMRLREGKSKLSVTRALERLQAIQLHRVRFGLRALSGLTKMTTEQLELFDPIDVTRPSADTL